MGITYVVVRHFQHLTLLSFTGLLIRPQNADVFVALFSLCL